MSLGTINIGQRRRTGNGEAFALDSGYPGPVPVLLLQLRLRGPDARTCRGDDATCKFWLQLLSLAANAGFSPREINRIRSILQGHFEEMTDAWTKHCGSS